MAVDQASVARAPPLGGAAPFAGVLRDGRLLLIALLAGYFLVLLLLALEQGVVPAWRRLGVFALDPSFADMRSITSAWECVRQGVEVLPVNPCDPWQRPANYPSIWLAPAASGLGQEVTVYLGIATALAFFASVFLLIGRPSLRDGLVYAVLLGSPAVMLGVERGNVDLLLFALVVLGIVLLRRWRALGQGLLLLAAVLKLFPVFACGALLRQPRRKAIAGAGVVLVIFSAYALATFEHIRAIGAAVPQEIQSSYGAAVGVEAFQQLVGRIELSALYPLTHRAGGPIGHVAVVVAGLGLAFVFARRWRLRGELPEVAADLDAFWAGAGVFCATFALFQNYDYRLIFLLLAVPQLLRWTRATDPRVPFAGWALVAVGASLWLGTGVPVLPLGLGDLWVGAAAWFPYEEIVNWLLFAYLAAALALTAGIARATRAGTAR